MKIRKSLFSGYIIILLGIFNKYSCESSLSTCQLKNPLKAQDAFADFTDICMKNGASNSKNSHCQLLCNQLERTVDLTRDKSDNKTDLISIILVIITITNIVLAFVLLNKFKFKLTNKIQIEQLENEEEIEETESENESISDEINSKHTKRELIEKCNNLENHVQELESEIVKLKKDKMDLIQTIGDQNKNIEAIDGRKNEKVENMKRNLKRKIHTSKDKLDNETSIDDVDVELKKTKQELNSIKKELEMKEHKISEMNAHIDMINNHADNLSDEIRNLNDQLKKSLIDLKSKDSEIEKLRDDIESKIIEIKKLEHKNEEIMNNFKCLQENSLSLSESDNSLSDEPCNSKISVLNEINRHTGNEFNSFNDRISLINKLPSNTDKEEEIIYMTEENFEKLEDTDRVRKLEMENEELHDKIYALERKCESMDKRYKKQLKSKDEDIEELQEELENAKLKKHQDNKSKTRIKTLEDKIEELQGDIESRTEKIKSKNEKLKEIEFKSNNFESRVGELEREIDKLKKDKFELTKLINIKNKSTDEVIQTQEKEIKEKENALDVMNKEVEEVKIEKDKLQMINAQQIVEINELKSFLSVEEEKYGKLNTVSNDQRKKIESYEMKIKTLEGEIHSIHDSTFKHQDNFMGNYNLKNEFSENSKWYPIWWDKHVLPDQSSYQQTNEQSNLIAVGNLKNMVVCPNCNVMYSHKEIESHVYKCLENDD